MTHLTLLWYVTQCTITALQRKCYKIIFFYRMPTYLYHRPIKSINFIQVTKYSIKYLPCALFNNRKTWMDRSLCIVAILAFDLISQSLFSSKPIFLKSHFPVLIPTQAGSSTQQYKLLIYSCIYELTQINLTR